MLLCRRVLVHLEFTPFRRFASGSTRPTFSRYDTGHVNSASGAMTGLFERLLALSKHSPHSKKKPNGMADLAAYKHLRIRGRQLLASLPMPSYFKLLVRATNRELGASASDLVEDMLEFFPDKERVSAVLKVVASPTLPLLRPGTLLLMLQCLENSPQKMTQLARCDIAVLVHTFALAPPDSADLPLLEHVFLLLLTHLKQLARPEGDALLTYNPPDIIHATFTFIDKLLQLSQHQRTLELFQILVNSGDVPSEAVQTIAGLNEFQSIVRSSLARASTHWQWRSLAQKFLSPLLEPRSSPSPLVVSLAVDTAYACLDHPTADDLHTSRTLISQIHQLSPVPDALIHEFYDAAEEAGAVKEAHALYAFTRSEEMLKTHRYPCPRSSASGWLLCHLLEGHSHHSLILARDVLEANLSLPLESRSFIVEELASRGHGLVARGLWSKFAIGKDREPFIQNPSLMIRMVSLFHHLAKRQDAILEDRANKPRIFLDNGAVREQSKEYKDFYRFVLSEFTRAHSPLQDAPHLVLTSRARACFIIGDFVPGFETVKILIDRKEMPDLYDINVTLTVMAEHNPRAAAQIVERMVQRGLQPDGITYGTVMHHALQHGDMELVNEMIQRVHALPDQQLSYKSIVALVRGSIALDACWDRNDLTQHSKLQSAFSIIQSVGRSTVVTSPHLGKFLVLACLRAHDPLMAFKFWELLLRSQTSWYDREQVFLRRLIKRGLNTHAKNSWLKDSHRRAMIAQLRLEEEVEY
ncbi:hypothetical protein B0H19DRAFT_980551 [Mycena capillaripes]|nr:hypothetical protein B0H19DRAFT_980551 [Mycena capillaripes]